MKKFLKNQLKSFGDFISYTYDISPALSIIAFLFILLSNTNTFILEGIDTVNHTFILAISTIILGLCFHVAKFSTQNTKYQKISIVLNKISLILYLIATVQCWPFIFKILYPYEIWGWIGYANKIEPFYARHFSLTGAIFIGLTGLGIINCLEFEIRFWWKLAKKLMPPNSKFATFFI